MGSGKTTIGKLLANKLKISFLDLDEVIEQGLEDSISNIFNGKGEIFFRKKEHRPLIKNIDNGDLPEFIGKHLFERNNFYLKANHIIECDDKDPESLVAEIQELLT